MACSVSCWGPGGSCAAIRSRRVGSIRSRSCTATPRPATMDSRRTILAVVLCVVAYYVWMMWVQYTTPATETPVAEAPVENDGTGGTDGGEPDTTDPVAPVEPLAPVASDFPVKELAFQACDAVGHTTTDGGVPARHRPHQPRSAVRRVAPVLVGVRAGDGASRVGPGSPTATTPGRPSWSPSAGRSSASAPATSTRRSPGWRSSPTPKRSWSSAAPPPTGSPSPASSRWWIRGWRPAISRPKSAGRTVGHEVRQGDVGQRPRRPGPGVQ